MISTGFWKQIIISVLGLTLILFIFASVTYAWVTMSQINNVDGISLTATSGNELEISFDGINYHQELSIFDQGEVLQLKDVTSTDGIHFQRGPMHLGEIAVIHQDYIQFDLYFRTTRKEHGLYLVNKPSEDDILLNPNRGTYVTSEGIPFVPKVNYTEENNQLILAQSVKTYYAKDAVRMSFSELDDQNEIITTMIYDPSENETRGYGKIFGAYSYFVNQTYHPLDLPSQVPETMYKLSTMEENNPYQAVNNNSLIAQLRENDIQNGIDETYYITKVRVHIWIEGWDVDAIDGILQDRIQVQLEFKLAFPA